MNDSSHRSLPGYISDLVCSLYETPLSDDEIVWVCLNLRKDRRAVALMTNFLETGEYTREQIISTCGMLSSSNSSVDSAWITSGRG